MMKERGFMDGQMFVTKVMKVVFFLLAFSSNLALASVTEISGHIQAEQDILLQNGGTSLRFPRGGRYPVTLIERGRWGRSDQILLRYKNKEYALPLSDSAVKNYLQQKPFSFREAHDLVVTGKTQIKSSFTKERATKVSCLYSGYCVEYGDPKFELEFRSNCAGEKNILQSSTTVSKELSLEFKKHGQLIGTLIAPRPQELHHKTLKDLSDCRERPMTF